MISRVAELSDGACHRLVYRSAFVPRDGERVADSLPAQFIEFLEPADALGADHAVDLPDQALREAFANTADEDTLARIREQLVPEPYAPIFEALSLPGFPTLRIPVVYITSRDELTMPPGTFHPGQSSPLREPSVIEIDGDHESLFTAPERLADALPEAVDIVETANRGRRLAKTSSADV